MALNKDQEETLKAIEANNKKLEETKEEVKDTSNIKVIQIIMDETDTPQLSYNNMTVTEVLGTLILSQELIVNRKIKSPLLKSDLLLMANSLGQH